MSRTLRRGGGILAGIVLLGIALRFATLGVQSFSDDELFSAWLMKMPLHDMLSTIPKTERTPYLFYIVDWVGGQAFGTGEVGLRLLPALFGSVTVPVVYLAGAIGASRRVGLAAALFVAVNPFLVWYSQEARSYSLLILLVAVSLVCLIAYAQQGRSRALAGWAVASAAAVATHYFALFLVVPEIVWVAARGPGRLRTRLALAAIPAVVAGALVPLMEAQRGAVGDRLGGAGRTLVERLVAIPKNFLVGFAIPFETLAVVVAGGAAAVVLWLALARTGDIERRLARACAALAGAGIALPLVIALLGYDYLQSRNTMATLIPVALLLGCGFAVGRLGAAALVVICLVSLVTVVGVAVDAKYQRRDWRGAARTLGRAKVPRLVIFSPPFKNLGPFRVYYGKSTSRLPGRIPPVQEIDTIALAEFSGFGPGADRPPSGPTPRPPEGFRIVQNVRTSTYRLVRFEARRPRVPTVPELFGTIFRRTPSVALWQPGPQR